MDFEVALSCLTLWIFESQVNCTSAITIVCNADAPIISVSLMTQDTGKYEYQTTYHKILPMYRVHGLSLKWVSLNCINNSN